ncbi:MAG: hypothetical protein GY913_35445 [Proteobacteria bacterium]|nr:hypothetical protein [Pseudomonadota bacterium]MCP4922227.1 hypothetical protein [Pseudomonadota bacterium]
MKTARMSADELADDLGPPIGSSELEARIRAELEAEHAERQERFEAKKERGKEKRERRRRVEAHADEQDLRRKMRADFHREQGYKEYVDSRGKTLWLPPEEYDHRVKARKAREARKSRYKAYQPPGQRKWLVWVGMVVFAVTVGFVLLRGG